MIFSSDNGGANKAGGYNNPLRGEKSELWDGGIKSGIVSIKFRGFRYGLTVTVRDDYTSHGTRWQCTAKTFYYGVFDA